MVFKVAGVGEKVKVKEVKAEGHFRRVGSKEEGRGIEEYIVPSWEPRVEW